MKTFNLYWIFSTCLVLWFLFIYSPYYFYTTQTIIDIPFGIHLWGNYSFSIVCIINTLLPPNSMYGTNKNKNYYYHNRIGQYGMIMGIIEFIFGVYCCVSTHLDKLPPSKSFSIVTGIIQLIFQLFSYASIKKYQYIKKQILQKKEENLQLDEEEQQQHHNSFSNHSDEIDITYHEIQLLEKQKQQYLIYHIFWNIALFTFICGAPALICLLRIFVPEDNPRYSTSIYVALLFLQVITMRYSTYLQKFIIVQSSITDNVNSIVAVAVVDPFQNNNNINNNITTSAELIVSCIDTTTTTTITTTNTDNTTIPLIQQP